MLTFLNTIELPWDQIEIMVNPNVCFFFNFAINTKTLFPETPWIVITEHPEEARYYKNQA
jgi:hypothetical protein